MVDLLSASIAVGIVRVFIGYVVFDGSWRRAYVNCEGREIFLHRPFRRRGRKKINRKSQDFADATTSAKLIGNFEALSGKCRYAADIKMTNQNQPWRTAWRTTQSTIFGELQESQEYKVLVRAALTAAALTEKKKRE